MKQGSAYTHEHVHGNRSPPSSCHCCGSRGWCATQHTLTAKPPVVYSTPQQTPSACGTWPVLGADCSPRAELPVAVLHVSHMLQRLWCEAATSSNSTPGTGPGGVHATLPFTFRWSSQLDHPACCCLCSLCMHMDGHQPAPPAGFVKLWSAARNGCLYAQRGQGCW
jgi:hypothetical protein